MPQKGEHTWDVIVHYHCCPRCGFVMENREDYEYRFGKYEKDLECERCHHQFTESKKVRPGFGPVFGEPTPVEWDWESEKD